MDDCICSCKHKYVLDQFLVKLNSKFGVKKELSVTIEKVHDYLGMTIDFTLPGKVVFTMFGYLEDIIFEAPADIRQKDNTNILHQQSKVFLMMMRTVKTLIP